MENANGCKRWGFQRKEGMDEPEGLTIREVMYMLLDNVNKDDPRPVITLANGDPSRFQCFRIAIAAEDAVVDAVRSAEYNCYAPSAGDPQARRAIADYLNRDLPYKLSADDVFLTVGCVQAIEVAVKALARPGANILLPRPGFSFYEISTASEHIESRHFDLLPEKGWEVDLDAVEALADENTLAMVIINPGNPCGNVYSYEHLKKIAETARKLGILVIADEVYEHISFGSTPFVPMGVFASIVPVLTLGAISKRWIVPGWRLGWLVTSDPNGILKETGMVKSIMRVMNISSDPATFVQGAVAKMIQNTKEEFFSNILDILRQAAEISYNRINEIPCMNCPYKPEGSMFTMVKLNLSMLEGISDDVEFCTKLAREESVIILPGVVVGMKNWVRVTIACELPSLEDGLLRMKAFCERHAKNQ